MTELNSLRPGRVWRNWGRSEAARPAFTATPTSVDGVVAIVRRARDRGLAIKTIGAGHSFSAVAVASGIQLDVSRLEGIVDVDLAAGQVTFGAGTRLHRFPDLLGPLGLALENMGDIDRQTIAGATSTGTHGTGAAFGGLATRIVAVTMVTADAKILRISETENAELLPAARLGLGALGIIVDLTVQCVPSFLLAAVEQRAAFDDVLDDFEALATGADHFEFYWWPHTDGVMTKSNSRLPTGAERRPIGAFAGWFEDRVLSNSALAALCNIGRLAPAATPPLNRFATRAYGNRTYTDNSHDVFVSARTTRFREMEYAIPRAAVPQALRDVRDLIDGTGWRISFPIEVRVAASDDTWLSTANGRDTGYIAVHRYFRDDHEDYFLAVEQLMRSHQGRPHWGKIHYQDSESLAALYPHHGDFVAVRDRLDPDRVFSNPYLQRVLGP